MSTTNFKGNPVNTLGTIPALGMIIPPFTLVKTDLSELKPADLQGVKVIYNIFPSVDTGTCAASVRKFNEYASTIPGTKIVCISKDLPFAQNRFCGAEGLENVVMASDFRGDFGTLTGLTLEESPLKGLLARSIIVCDEEGKIIHTELVSEITEEPQYENALESIKQP